MARLPYIDPQTASPEVRGALQALPQLNIFAMLAHADTALIPYLALGGALLAQLQLDPQLRELAILLTAKHTSAEYEWIQHVGISRALGIDNAQISAVEHGDLQAACFDTDAQIVLRFTSEVLQRPRADDETFNALRERFPPRQIVELLLVIGSYQMLARIMTTLDIDLDPAIGSTITDQAQRLLSRTPPPAGANASHEPDPDS
jgi:4-carboxymuconolactone decarboxylase